MTQGVRKVCLTTGAIPEYLATHIASSMPEMSYIGG